jgi:hypothetical protein
MALLLPNGLSIDKVFQFVQFVANKEHRGWVSPEEFNIAAEVIQLTLYSELEGVYAITKDKSADLRPFQAYTATLTDAGSLPTGFRIPISASIVAGGTAGNPVKEIDISELPDIKASTVVPPSATYPIFYIDGEDNKVYTLPNTITIKINYLKAPIPPVWAYTTVSSRPVYAEASSTNFGFDPTKFMDISIRILEHIGINIGKEEITKYAMSTKQQG